MILSAIALSRSNHNLPSTIIVGSGPVGVVLARGLAELGVPSLVLEAGSDVADRTLGDLEIDATAFDLRGATIGRTRQIGGGLNLWGGQLASLRGDERAPTGDSPEGWPFDCAELTSRYGEATRLLGQATKLDVAQRPEIIQLQKGLKQAQLDVLSTAWLRVPKLHSSIWSELAKSSLVTVAHGAVVDRLVLKENGNVVGVRVALQDGSQHFINGRAIVLACGTIETIRLLLLPPLGAAATPWGRLDWLGRGFNEHLDAAVATVLPQRPDLLSDLFDPFRVEGVKYVPKTFASISAGDMPALHAVGMLTMPGNVRNSLSELRMLLNGVVPREALSRRRAVLRTSCRLAREVLPIAMRYMRQKRILTVLRGAGTFRVSVEQPVRHASQVLLSSERDRHGVPRARVNWIKGEAEGNVFLEKAKRFKHWADNLGVATVTIDPVLISSPRTFAENADDGFHHAGGARMSTSPRDGVVDCQLAVHLTHGLYCCGAAVFPRMGYANPTLNAAALAVRLAEHLANDKNLQT